MGIHTVIVVRFSDFEKITCDKSFGEKLFHAGKYARFVNEGFEWVGEVDSSESLAIFHYDGIIWTPRLKKVKERKPSYNIQPPEHFCLLGISGDFADYIHNKKKVGEQTVKAIQNYKPDLDGQSVHVDGYTQAIYIVNIFSSDDVGISVLEGNCSWIAGKKETPTWARAAKQNHPYTREISELILALRQGIKVNLTAKKYQELARYF